MKAFSSLDLWITNKNSPALKENNDINFKVSYFQNLPNT